MIKVFYTFNSFKVSKHPINLMYSCLTFKDYGYYLFRTGRIRRKLRFSVARGEKKERSMAYQALLEIGSNQIHKHSISSLQGGKESHPILMWEIFLIKLSKPGICVQGWERLCQLLQYWSIQSIFSLAFFFHTVNVKRYI